MNKSFHTSASRRKALENWKRPSIGEMGVPTESHTHVFTKNQKRYNMQLLAGVGFFGATLLVAANTVELNATPSFTKITVTFLFFSLKSKLVPSSLY